MNFNNKVLAILFSACVLSAVVAGVCLVQLLSLFGELSESITNHPVALAFSIALYLLGGLVLLLIFSFLVSKKTIVPAVEREFMEKERAVLAKQLQQAQKMESLGKLAGSIAHDFNNLLTIVDGYSSLIVANPSGEQNGQYAQEVVEAARKATTITRKLLNFSRQEKVESVLVNLNDALNENEKMLSRLIGEQVTLVIDLPESPVFTKIDPVQVGQLLMNLVVNARDAMPDGGRIRIALGNRLIADEERGKPGKLPEGRYAEIAVCDSGCGIEASILSHIFEAFYSTKPESEGSGLGLSIVKSILKDNHGFAYVESAPGKGSNFFLYLPLVDPVEHNVLDQEEVPGGDIVVEEADVVDATSDEITTVLLAEDDVMIRNLVQQTLEKQGYTVLLAEDGWEGIKVARTHKGRIDLLFSDIVMPGLGGAELAVALRELYPSIKILFMSGYSREQLEVESVPLDAIMLEKPFTTDKVISTIHELLNKEG